MRVRISNMKKTTGIFGYSFVLCCLIISVSSCNTQRLKRSQLGRLRLKHLRLYLLIFMSSTHKNTVSQVIE